MPGRITDRVAFITGVARGLGRANAVWLAEEGADIIGVDRLGLGAVRRLPHAHRRRPGRKCILLVEKTGRRIVAIKADVTDRPGLAAALDQGRETVRSPRHRGRQRRNFYGERPRGNCLPNNGTRC